jgi:hypothetical protein
MSAGCSHAMASGNLGAARHLLISHHPRPDLQSSGVPHLVEVDLGGTTALASHSSGWLRMIRRVFEWLSRLEASSVILLIRVLRSQWGIQALGWCVQHHSGPLSRHIGCQRVALIDLDVT